MKFTKAERLHKKKLIQELFDKGSSFYLFPFKVIVMNNPEPESPVHQVLISVSKRNFKHAVQRNLIKRRTREAFRLNNKQLTTSKKLVIAYIYTAKEILTFAQIQDKIVRTFNRFDHVEKL